MIVLYKILHNKVEISFEQYRVPITTATRGHSQLFQQVTAQLDVHSPHGQGLATTNHQIQHCFGISDNKTPRRFCRWFGKSEEFYSQASCKPDAQPCYYRPRPVPHSLHTKLEKQLKHLESSGIIEPSSSVIGQQ